MPTTGEPSKKHTTPDKDNGPRRSIPAPASAPAASPTPRVTRHAASVGTSSQEVATSMLDAHTQSSPVASTTLESSIGRMTRKRAASLQTRLESSPSIESPAPVARSGSSSIISGPRSSDPATQVCLCPPDPKIPRPRNGKRTPPSEHYEQTLQTPIAMFLPSHGEQAFMLYRQHFQASIVAQNPGLANPDISKIIGQQWRDESQELRAQWDALAEEEKVRHNTAYPGYKYQPRRKGKKGAASTATSGSATGANFEDYPLCEKCGKRSLTVPQTPSTASLSGSATTPFFPAQQAHAASTNRFLPSISTQSLSFSQPAPSARSMPTGRVDPSLSAMNVGSPHQPLNEPYTPHSPDPKRRRISHNTVPYYSTPSPPQPTRHYVDIQRRNAHSMAPPPRPHDLGLTLAPIQTAAQQQAAHTRSVQALVMTISHIDKLGTLARIAPALRAPGPASPPHPIRGVIISVDAEDPATIQSYTTFLHSAISSLGEFMVQIFEPPQETMSRGDPTTGITVPLYQQKEVADYLSHMSKWHDISRALVTFVTTPIPRSGPGPPLIPIAIVAGFALSTSNAWASMLPIADQYTPVEHWTWSATLWRGVVGADLTLWVRNCSRAERDQFGDVEVRRENKAIVVRACEDDGEIEKETSRRRVGFEIGEYVRRLVRRI
ncbi:MAG: hypothetical protein M1814_001803 [Vezdaea aestivalis]|nr:MAG: hypothetical protein M1814_001803 [Vezdaea aestivalis]